MLSPWSDIADSDTIAEINIFAAFIMDIRGGDIKLKMALNGINKVLGGAGGIIRIGLPVREYYLMPVKCPNNTQLRG